jgi:chromatin segregation and condensation protein Rec8/ScpA/Scc1 (kleisin family)
LLELIRLKQIQAVQPEDFGEIEICAVAAASAPSPAITEPPAAVQS